jgi:Type II CAAX prenyl endopeptidase Rce1-like
MSRASAAQTRAGGALVNGKTSRGKTSRALSGYFKRSERPLHSLAFIAPLILIHEIGWRLAGPRLLAFYLLHRFFAMFGASGMFLPALALIGILLTWHVACRDSWSIHLPTLLGMLAESVVLALPLLALAAGLAHWNFRTLLAGYEHALADRIVISMGAGIYEEMIFRLIGLTLLNILFVDILSMRKNWAIVLMVLISSISFSLYHYLGPEPFAWKTCLFRTVAGIYFAVIFLCRGFGVTAGTHAIYDVIISALAPA